MQNTQTMVIPSRWTLDRHTAHTASMSGCGLALRHADLGIVLGHAERRALVDRHCSFEAALAKALNGAEQRAHAVAVARRSRRLRRRRRLGHANWRACRRRRRPGRSRRLWRPGRRRGCGSLHACIYWQSTMGQVRSGRRQKMRSRSKWNGDQYHVAPKHANIRVNGSCEVT